MCLRFDENSPQGIIDLLVGSYLGVWGEMVALSYGKDECEY